MFRTVEGTIKKQAKEILAKNNWAKSIIGTLCVMSAVAVGVLVFDGATLLMSEDILKNSLNLALMVVLCIVSLVVFLLLSPVYTGYVRFIDKCRSRETGNAEDIFYYFSKSRYIHTVQLNLLLALFYGLMFIVCLAPAIVMLVLSGIGMGNQTVFQICALWLAIFGGLAFFIVSRFLNMTTYLYVANFNYKKEIELVKASVYIVKTNLSKVINLYISYLPWLIPCFFVLPIVFVYPYFKHSVVLSQSFIYDIENDTQNSPYFQSNVQISTQPDFYRTVSTTADTVFNGVSEN